MNRTLWVGLMGVLALGCSDGDGGGGGSGGSSGTGGAGGSAGTSTGGGGGSAGASTGGGGGSAGASSGGSAGMSTGGSGGGSGETVVACTASGGCVEHHLPNGDPNGTIASSCTGAGGVVSSACTLTPKLGCCNLANNAGSTCYFGNYANGSTTVAKQACEGAGGTWVS